MPTTFVKGDLFDEAKGSGLAFAAECSGVMTKGVGAAFKKRWPAFAEAYQERAAKGMQPGDVFMWKEEDVVLYALAIYQGEKKPKLTALTRAVDTMVARAAEDGVARIALPRIATGFDPVRAKRVLTDAGTKSAVYLVVFEQFVRKKAAE